MIMYQRVENPRIKDKAYSLEYIYHDDNLRNELITEARSEFKISSHEGYFDVFCSPRPKIDVVLLAKEIIPSSDNSTPEEIVIDLKLDKWEKSNITRWSNLVL